MKDGSTRRTIFTTTVFSGALICLGLSLLLLQRCVFPFQVGRLAIISGAITIGSTLMIAYAFKRKWISRENNFGIPNMIFLFPPEILSIEAVHVGPGSGNLIAGFVVTLFSMGLYIITLFFAVRIWPVAAASQKQDNRPTDTPS